MSDVLFGKFKFMSKYAPGNKRILYYLIAVYECLVGFVIAAIFIATRFYVTDDDLSILLLQSGCVILIFSVLMLDVQDRMLKKTMLQVCERAEQLPYDETTEMQEDFRRWFPRLWERAKEEQAKAFREDGDDYEEE